MQIDVLKVPKLIVQSPRWTEETLHLQITEAQAEAEALPSVVAARAELDAANASSERLTKRQAQLNVRAAELWKGLGDHSGRVRDALLADEALTEVELQASGKVKAEHDGIGCAIDMLVTSLVPQAKATLIRAEAAYLRAQAAGIIQIATARAQIIVAALATLADQFGCVEIDLGRIPLIADLLNREDRLCQLARSNEAYLETLPKAKKG